MMQSLKNLNQMIRIFTVLFSLTFISNCILAQEAKSIGKSFWTISYFGEKIFHPGLQLSLNRSLYLSRDIENQKNRIDIGISITNYSHPKNHFGFRLTPNFSFIHSSKSGSEYGIIADAGFMRRFYQGKVFEVDYNGNVEQKYFAGQNAFTYGIYLLFAKNWHSSNLKNVRLFIDLGTFQETNYNGGKILHPVVNIGISKYLNLTKR
jgi:hypothetical protein